LKTSYQDIMSATSAAPYWWDAEGVPRFQPFSPEMLGYYDNLAVLVAIECVGCGVVFHVGASFQRFAMLLGGTVHRDVKSLAENFVYGEPPRHGCRGDDRFANELTVLEAWEVSRDGVWERYPEHECFIDHSNFYLPLFGGPPPSHQA
jgi:hypothetical protein